MSEVREPITVRVAREADFPFIARIQQMCPEAAQWPTGDYSQFEIFLAFSGKMPAGFCAWRRTGSEEAEILNLGIDPAFRRQGIASALLQRLTESVRCEIFLEVAEPNTAAIALYEKLGWRRIALRRGYYSCGKINAIVMKKRSW